MEAALPWNENRKNDNEEIAMDRMNRSPVGFRRRRSITDGAKPANVSAVLQQNSVSQMLSITKYNPIHVLTTAAFALLGLHDGES